MVGACASGLLTLLAGADLIEHGRCPWAVVGVADRSLQDLDAWRVPQSWRMLRRYAAAVHAGQGHWLCAQRRGRRLPTLIQLPSGPGSYSGHIALGDASHETRCDDVGALVHMLERLCGAMPSAGCHHMPRHRH